MPRPMLSAIVLALAAVSAAAEGIRVESDGEVRWIAGEGGAGRLLFTGGVRVASGDALLTAREAEVVLGADGLANVALRGEVVYESAEVGLRADSATMRRAGPGERDYVVRLERRENRPIAVRAGEMLMEAGGPVVLDAAAGRITLEGRLRAETPNAVMRAETAEVLLAKPEKPETEPAAEGEAAPPEAEAEAPWRLERVSLEGGVEISIRPVGGSERSERRARSARAVYSAADDTLLLDGTPAPVVDATGVSMTAPAIMLHLAEGRIESSTGELRAIIRTEDRER